MSTSGMSNTICSAGKLNDLRDYFKTNRQSCTYRYRIEFLTSEVESFLSEYQEEAKKTRTIVETKLNNPDPKSIAYLSDLIGSMDFQFDRQFIYIRVEKAIPRANNAQKSIITDSILKEMTELKNSGKSEGAIKNLYTKIIYWLSSKFESVCYLVGNSIPKFLIRYYPSQAELALYSILANSGCDILFLLDNGDSNYLSVDTNSTKTTLFNHTGNPIPENYAIKSSQTTSKVNSFESRPTQAVSRPTPRPQPAVGTPNSRFSLITNEWMPNGDLNDIKTTNRGDELDKIYNSFIQCNGAWNRNTYVNDLYQFYNDLKKDNRQICIVEKSISNPTVEESKLFSSSMADNENQAINELASQIKYDFSPDLKSMMINAFKEVILNYNKTASISVGKLTNKAKTLLCWLKRYESQILRNWKKGQIGCFIYLNGCNSENEALFLQMLSKLPVDVIVLNPNKNETVNIAGISIKEYPDSIVVDKYPMDPSQFRIGTVAYHAERDLDTLLYQDSGIYRNRQYSRATSVILSTMYEEIDIFWNQELKFRPGFNTDESVTVPVLLAKVSGVKDGNIKNYWSSIQKLVTPDTIVATKPAYMRLNENDRQLARLFVGKDGVFRDKIRNHNSFQYGYLRDETLEYMFDKLDLLLKNKTIKGMFESGTEYDVAATVLNLPKNIVRLIQAFDFTQKNPKMIYVLTDESPVTIEDAILVNYLSLIGFDVVIFVPTGYQSIEKFLNMNIEEHQIGPFVYDTKIPSKITQQSQTENKTTFSRLKELFS